MRQIGRASKGKNERKNKQDDNGAKRECGAHEAPRVRFARKTRNRRIRNCGAVPTKQWNWQS